jgi:small subunit ribosomal protein S10e
MYIPKKIKKTILSQLFRDGILVIKLDKKNHRYENLVSIKVMKSLVSKGLVSERYSWNFYYFILKDNGVDYLRKFLNIPNSVTPLTHIAL